MPTVLACLRRSVERMWPPRVPTRFGPGTRLRRPKNQWNQGPLATPQAEMCPRTANSGQAVVCCTPLAERQQEAAMAQRTGPVSGMTAVPPDDGAGHQAERQGLHRRDPALPPRGTDPRDARTPRLTKRDLLRSVALAAIVAAATKSGPLRAETGD